MADQDEIRWPLGEAVMQNNRFVPGAFIFVYAAVIGWKHLRRLVTRSAVSARHALYVRLHRWSARGLAANDRHGPGAGY
jgi:hypothetical protein